MMIFMTKQWLILTDSTSSSLTISYSKMMLTNFTLTTILMIFNDLWFLFLIFLRKKELKGIIQISCPCFTIFWRKLIFLYLIWNKLENHCKEGKRIGQAMSHLSLSQAGSSRFVDDVSVGRDQNVPSFISLEVSK